MKIRRKELEKALEYIKTHGDAQEVDIALDDRLQRSVIIKTSIFEDEASIIIFEAELNIFPKITTTERL